MSPRIQYLMIIPSLLFIVACGEMPQNDEEQLATAAQDNDIYVNADVNCSPESLNGYYETLMIRRTGDCPDLEPFVLRMTDGQMSWGKNCTTQSVAFSEGSCQQDTAILCEADGLEIVVESRLAQLEEAGSILTGNITIQFKTGEEASSAACVSQYQAKLERFQ